MASGEVVALRDQANEPSILSRNLKIAEFLELCIQPEERKEIKRRKKENIVLQFWNEFQAFSGNENFCEFDFACMYALNYVYKDNSVSLTAVSRCVYAYLEQFELMLGDENRNRPISCGTNCFLTGLRNFTNFESEEGIIILAKVLVASLMDGNLGFAHFLVKFNLVDFPSEDNEKSKAIFEELVEWFNISCDYINRNVPPDMPPEIYLHELLEAMTYTEFSFRRSMLIFSTICIVADYMMYERLWTESPELGLNLFESRMKPKYMSKISCLDLYADTTTETNITFTDTEIFVERVLNPLLCPDFGRPLVETSRRIMRTANAYYNPRALKDLIRCKIRACVPTSMMLTEHVKQFTKSDAIKRFILFHSEKIWDLMTENQITMRSIRLLNRRIRVNQNVPDN